MADEACRKCGNTLFLTDRVSIGSGISELRCWRCGCYNEIYPPDMKQTSGAAKECIFPGCEDGTDTDYGNYCAVHRNFLRMVGKMEKRRVKGVVGANGRSPLQG